MYISVFRFQSGNRLLILNITITTNESEFSYKVNETGILELDGNFGSKLKFTFEKSMPPETIVDVIYKDANE